MKDTGVKSIRKMIAFLTRLERFRLTKHAEQRCIERGVTIEDISAVLLSPTKLQREENNKWRILGQDLDDIELKIIAEIRSDILIITLF